MERLKMQTPNMAEENFKKLKELFPEAVTEVEVDGVIKPAIDKDVLQQLISNEVVEGPKERYQFTWPGKHEAMLLAGKPTKNTLRPVKGENPVDDAYFNTTENLYIEGDNLEVLKILETKHAGKIKMIYIDPPYNTGNDFIYKDKFDTSKQEYLEDNGERDDEGNRLVKNMESNGRFHSDWLSMMYPRLIKARNLLSDDGVIFISIDDNEQENLKKICDEIFGKDNCIANFVWVKKKKGSHLSRTTRSMTEYVLSYAKYINSVELYGENAYSDKQQPLAKRTNSLKQLVFPANLVKTTLSDNKYNKGFYGEGTSGLRFKEDFIVNKGIINTKIVVEGPFIWTQPKLNEEIKLGTIINLSSKFGFNVLRADQDSKIKRPSTLIDNKVGVGTNEDAYNEGIELFKKEGILDYPKPVSLLKYILNSLSYFDKDSIILDFFSGSATTAHAVMQLNAEDGGHRKFIMVQLPEPCDEKSEAYKAGYKNICEIGKERIRRAGKKILEEYKNTLFCKGGCQAKPDRGIFDYNAEVESNAENENLSVSLCSTSPLKKGSLDCHASNEARNDGNVTEQSLDIGFRVLRLDSSNMKDVFYRPRDLKKDDLLSYTSNIKEDRTDLDLLFQAMPEIAGADYDAKIDEITISNKKVFKVNNNYIVACFEESINEEVIREIAKLKPYHAIFRDSGFSNDSLLANLEQIFRIESPDTEITVL